MLPCTVRRLLHSLVASGWLGVAHGAGRVAHLRAEAWQPGARALVVAPHPDDETLGAGGVIALHAAAGDAVTVAVVSDGGQSRALGLARAEMVARRRRELDDAMALLGGGAWHWLGLPEGAWHEAEAAAQLAPLMGAADVIYAPSCVDFHPEHLRVARVVAGLVRPAHRVRVMELGVPLTPMLANRVANIGAVAGQKARALACFESQQGALRPLERLARYRAALYRQPATELFWELPAPAYQRLMAAGAWGWETTPFRGLRPWPVSDPLAWLVGWRARQWLRAVAAGA